MELSLPAAPVSPRARWKRWLVGLVATPLVLWAAAVGALWWGQETVLFRPAPLPSDHRFAVPADVQETWIEVPGARLNALHLRLPDARGVVFYLHGNGSNLAGWFVNPGLYRDARLDLFMIDYRGYGKSTGRITSEAQLLADARAAWLQIAPLYAGKQRIFLGRSLGTGLAAQLAAEVQPEKTVLVSPYASMARMASEKYPFVPQAVLRYPLRSDLALPKIQGPVLLLHGARDELIPPDHGRTLAGLARQGTLVVVDDAGHGDIHRFEAYSTALRSFLGVPK